MKTLTKKLRPFLRKRKEIIDLIIFGSVAKGNVAPKDVDIAVLTKDDLDRSALKKELRQCLKKKVDVQLFSLEDYTKFLWITLIREGYSVRHGNYLHQIYRIQPVVLYKYSLLSLTKSKKVMFDRAIKSFLDVEKLSNRVVLVPITRSGEFGEFLESWGIDFDSQEYGLLPLVRKKD